MDSNDVILTFILNLNQANKDVNLPRRLGTYKITCICILDS